MHHSGLRRDGESSCHRLWHQIARTMRGLCSLLNSGYASAAHIVDDAEYRWMPVDDERCRRMPEDDGGCLSHTPAPAPPTPPTHSACERRLSASHHSGSPAHGRHHNCQHATIVALPRSDESHSLISVSSASTSPACEQYRAALI